MTPRALFFDLDNTLVHRAQSLACYAAQFATDFAGQLAQVDHPQICAVLQEADNGGYLRPDCGFASIKECIAHALQHRLPWQSAVEEATLRSHWAKYSAELNVPMPGAAELIAALVQRGIRVGIISNGAQHSRAVRVNSLPFHAQIDALISSGEYGIKKPDARLFQLAAAKLQLAVQDCWYVGDHPVNDVLGAQAAGMRAIWLRGFHDWPVEHDEPKDHIRHLGEIMGLLDAFRERDGSG